MLNFVLPAAEKQADVSAFYCEMAQSGDTCIDMGNYENYVLWLTGMQNCHTGHNLPDGYVRKDFSLCYEGQKLICVFSLKFELTDFLLRFGGHVGYAVRPSERNRGLAAQILRQGLALAKAAGFERILCVCDADNYASEKVILKNGGALENELYDPDEKVMVKRFWIQL